MTRPLTALFAFALAACGQGRGSQNAPSVHPSGTPSQMPMPTPSGVEPARADFDVHEWGVFDVAPGPDQTGSLHSSPIASAPSPIPIQLRKPVVYVHLAANSAPLSLNIGVLFEHGVVAENFPDGLLAAADRGVTWSQITANPRNCHNAERFSTGDPRCAQSSDGICERTELATYETADSACLVIGGIEHNHLFYRGRNMQVTLPIALGAPSRTGATGIVARNTTARSLAGDLLRVRTGETTVVESLSTPPPGGETPMWPQVTTPVDGRARLRSAAVQFGLTDQEADAFMRAWGDELFGASQTRDLRRAQRESPPRTSDVLLYFMPDYIVDRMAPLTITPAPNTIHRVILVRQPLPR